MGILIEDCLTIEQLINRKENGTLEEVTLDVDDVFLNYPKIVLTDYCSKQFLNGVKQTIDNLPQSDLYLIYDASGTFLGLGYRDTITNQLRVKKIFLD
jgi:tRNA U55 pseudouridine synthase TruB